MHRSPPLATATRAWILIAVLVLEGLAISVAYDIAPLFSALGLGSLKLLTILPVILVLAFVVLRRDDRAALPLTERTVRPGWFITHLVAIVTFVEATTLGTTSPAPAVSVAWFGSGVAVIGSLVLAAFEPKTLRAFAARERSTIGLAVVVGGIAFASALLFESAWPWMASSTLSGAHAVLSVFYPNTFVDAGARALGTPDFYVIVAKTCAGGEGIGLMATLAGAYLFVRRERLRWPAAWLLLPAAVLLAWTANVLRIAALTSVGLSWSPEVALAGFHSRAGWVLYCVLALVLTRVAERHLSRDARRGNARFERSDALLPLFIGPMLAALALQLLTGLFIVDLDVFYPHRFLLVGVVTAYAVYRIRPRLSASLFPVLTGAVVFMMWMFLADRGDPADIAAKRAQLEAMPMSTLWIATRAIGSSLVVPIAEELAFRGYLMRRLVSERYVTVSYRQFAPLAWVVSSLAFGALHTSFFAGCLAGLAFAAVTAYRGRLGDAMVAHSVANVLIAVAVLYFDAWWLWL